MISDIDIAWIMNHAKNLGLLSTFLVCITWVVCKFIKAVSDVMIAKAQAEASVQIAYIQQFPLIFGPIVRTIKTSKVSIGKEVEKTEKMLTK